MGIGKYDRKSILRGLKMETFSIQNNQVYITMSINAFTSRPSDFSFMTFISNTSFKMLKRGNFEKGLVLILGKNISIFNSKNQVYVFIRSQNIFT